MSKMPRYEQSPDTTSGPSARLWADCPWMEALEDPGVGYGYFTDYLEPVNETSAVTWTVTQVNSGAIANADETGGALVFDSAGHNAADDGISAQMLDAAGGEYWKPASGKTLWFEARLKMADAATTPDQMFIGLCDRETAIISSGLLDYDSRSMIGFYVDSASTAGKIGRVTAKAGSADAQADLAGADAIADDTYFKVGFKVYTEDHQLKVDFFFNGSKAYTYGTVTDTDDIPIVNMALSVVSQCEQTSADAKVTVDWFRIFQLR